jgi:hypothetical protein
LNSKNLVRLRSSSAARGFYLYLNLMNNFRTCDLSLAATLLYEKCHLIELDRSKKKVEFIFEDSPHLQRIASEFWRDQLPYPAQALFAALKRAKHVLFDGHI